MRSTLPFLDGDPLWTHPWTSS
ncbi:hypothetical protein FMEAI12_3280021 [Parafrankia sp. Ea1.12]|nr:hypothetical protein FMEAI12_3280021 [Parafrankia sp. Ea1.12]